MSDRILALLHRQLLRFEKPTPKVKRLCYACWHPIEGPGYRYHDRDYCDSLCVPPFMIGDPRG